MAAEALELHVAGMAEDGTPLPEPSALAAINEDSANRHAVAVLVDVQALAVDNRGCWAGRSAGLFTAGHVKRVMNVIQRAAVFPRRK